ncbi:MAG TPA: type III pantothenate kinase [Kiritimatiellia bacterium]|mgnify:CR=1 FL=1|nr:type III pantothenate kinase [Kiritimatiellia bacterium]HNS80371.1 type III pantothenate kinase [Kiritimatiellia bacterium]
MTKPILTIDIGNTSVAVGLYENGEILRQTWLRHRDATAELLDARLMESADGITPCGAAMASVVPDANDTWRGAVERLFGFQPMRVTCESSLGIPVTYPRPETIGADRLANAAGAAVRYGLPVIVADFGTALTFDIVSAVNGYIGGVIAPGLPLMFDYLAEKTALLPHIKPEPAQTIIGKSTEDAIRSGARWGYLGMVREILRRVEEEMGEANVTVCATGGFAPWVLDGMDREIIFDHSLTLFGIGHIYELNQAKQT